jgi:hypothetical protein
VAQRPFLIFPEPTIAARSGLGGGGIRLHRPSPLSQKQRLDQKFQSIATGIRSVQTTTQGVEPEQVIVFETRGNAIENLVKAAAKIPGLEWLAEMDLEDVTPDTEFFDEVHPDAALPCRLYAVMTNQRAMDQVISLWNTWTANPDTHARKGFGPFKDLFKHLSDVRRWGPQDRIQETQIVQDWEAGLRDRADQPERFEAELWFRRDATNRASAYTTLQSIVASEGGSCLAQAAVETISYHGVLVEMPALAISRTLEQIRQGRYTDLLRCEGVMFFRPLGQSDFVATPPSDGLPELNDTVTARPRPQGSPTVAVLDGLPLERHAALDGRLLIDDPDNYAAQYQARQQIHGSAIASLIVHGDLGNSDTTLTVPIYARPILTPSEDFQRNVYENIPSNTLVVDLIHRAVRRFAVELEQTRSSVRIVNLSIGDNQKPFIRELSPLARLLDWLSWEFKLLFLVSAGNQMQSVDLSLDGDAFQRLSDDEAISQTLHAMRDDQPSRRHWSPAEAVNVITVGAVHADHSNRLPQDRRVDLLRNSRLPSPFGTVGAGFKRAVKPEILMPGGRLMYRAPHAMENGRGRYEPSPPGQTPPGNLVASPGVGQMELGRLAYSCGTSNATALATRTAATTLMRLQELLRDYRGLALADDQIAVLLKTILVHGATWGAAGEAIERIFAAEIVALDRNRQWQERNRLKARFLGFGEVDPDRCLFCTDQRATVLGWGYLRKDAGHDYRLPLPQCLSAQRVARRLTMTLGWLTPINCQHRDYRKAHLWFTFNKKVLGVDNANLDQDSAERGTVVHQVFEGAKGRAFADDNMSIRVSCREQAGGLTEDIPYAFAATLEVADALALPIYNEIREHVRPQVPIRPGGPSS